MCFDRRVSHIHTVHITHTYFIYLLFFVYLSKHIFFNNLQYKHPHRTVCVEIGKPPSRFFNKFLFIISFRRYSFLYIFRFSFSSGYLRSVYHRTIRLDTVRRIRRTTTTQRRQPVGKLDISRK